jgi:hypothetical protein
MYVDSAGVITRPNVRVFDHFIRNVLDHMFFIHDACKYDKSRSHSRESIREYILYFVSFVNKYTYI